MKLPDEKLEFQIICEFFRAADFSRLSNNECGQLFFDAVYGLGYKINGNEMSRIGSHIRIKALQFRKEEKKASNQKKKNEIRGSVRSLGIELNHIQQFPRHVLSDLRDENEELKAQLRNIRKRYNTLLAEHKNKDDKKCKPHNTLGERQKRRNLESIRLIFIQYYTSTCNPYISCEK